MSENNTNKLKTLLIFLSLLTTVFIILSFAIAYFVWSISPVDKLIENETEALKTTATIFGGIAVMINAFFAAQRADAMDKTAKAALKNTEIADDKQITERFAKAIEQLGNDKIETRLGAIYTLERIAKDSPKDHWTIMEIVTAFVRENAPLKNKKEEKTENTETLINNSLNVQKPEEIKQQPKIRTDIQAALTVIGRRNYEYEQGNQRLDLSNIDIRDANLIKANLERVDFIGSNLEGALLREARLQNAYFNGASLQWAVISETNLQKVDLSGANLQQANLYRANLQRSFLQGANLYMTNLSEAKLQGANLKAAKNLISHQIESAEGDNKTILPSYINEVPENWQKDN
ncbi:pentapeptide repeat-containing protein [Nostoc sp. FACHB-888]|uniref:pentapeptide repeat-containing protein n=1 Tax=Nostoc sp. FACHB-888 TaxID=2692842 RepID=UPI001683737B|nr:pentapeptide repeat-containing protein [Nostoc sp. FACHB-888]MBD2247558.1 pentapeptide repeat-containing protein [Nostoc sp. FACHB-888]